MNNETTPVDREQLIEMANELGLEFPKNIPTPKLQAMVNEALDDTPAEPEPVNEIPPKSPEVKKETVESEEGTAEEPKLNVAQQRMLEKRLRIKKAKDAAMKTRVVTLTNKDPREADTVTTAYLSFENQYFGISKIVPLDVPVELEQALIDNAESTMITLHKAEVIDGKRTGNKVPVTVKKYAISYGKQETE